VEDTENFPSKVSWQWQWQSHSNGVRVVDILLGAKKEGGKKKETQLKSTEAGEAGDGSTL